MKLFSRFYKNIHSRFIRENKGAVIVEGAFTLMALATIIALIVDLGTSFVNQSRLERATYSAASVFRERIALYDDALEDNQNAPVTQSEVNQLRKILSQLVSDDNLAVVVEELQFEPDPNGPAARPTIAAGYPKKYVATGSSGKGCESSLPDFKSAYTLSPYSSRKRWLPLYRVTACFPGKTSWFKGMVNSSGSSSELIIKEFVSFNIVIPR